MTPSQMAQIHTAAFSDARGWTPDEFADLLGQPYVSALIASGGFALVRTLAGESELLTLAIDPAVQRRGIGQRLVSDWLTVARLDAETAFLEVADDNAPALALYTAAGFLRTGVRHGYYVRADAAAVDAVLMSRSLTQS